MEAIDQFCALLAFIINLIFFCWFGSTLSSINRQTKASAAHAEIQTKLLASIANAVADAIKPTVRGR